MGAFTIRDYEKLVNDVLSGHLDWYEREDLLYDPDFFSSKTKSDEKQSELIDKIFGLNTYSIETKLISEAQKKVEFFHSDNLGMALHEGRQTWVGLDPETLQTPYREFWEIFEILRVRPGEHVIDLGAAYGRMGVVLACYEPKAFFTGFEYVKERVDEGNHLFQRLGLENARIKWIDLASSDFKLTKDLGDIYFIYEYGRVDQIRQTLKELQESSLDRKVSVVARGKACVSLIENKHPWLSQVFEFKRLEHVTIFSNHPRLESFR